LRKTLFFLIFIFSNIFCYSFYYYPKYPYTYKINCDVKIPTTPKKFIIDIKYPNKRLIAKKSITNFFKSYFGETQIIDDKNKDAYIFNIKFERLSFDFIMVDKKITKKSIFAEISIKIYSPQKKLLLEMFFSKKVKEKDYIDDDYKQILEETFLDILKQLNQNENYLAFLYFNKPNKTIIDESTSFSNRTKYYYEVINKNKANYRLVFSFSFSQLAGSFNFNPFKDHFNYYWSVSCISFDFFINNVFSIEYRFDFWAFLFSSISYGLRHISNPPDASNLLIANNLYFNFNFYETPYANPNIYLITGFLFNSYIKSADDSFTPAFSPSDDQINRYRHQNIFGFPIGLGIKVQYQHPYASSFGDIDFFLDFFYLPAYNSTANTLSHNLGFSTGMKLILLKVFVSNEKPYKIGKMDKFEYF